jgi:thiopurine S-methyltransferase
MEHEFWKERWQEDQIGFHEGRVNRYLQQYWSQLDPGADETVFVPLCGKAADLAWLNERGHRVVGVELSEMACSHFFAERGIEPEVTREDPFTCYHHDGITILCGDFFALTRNRLDGARLFYDRAALIALPPDMRKRYTRHLVELMGPDARGLLITLDYPEQAFGGPPFAVSDTEVRQHLADHFTIDRLHHASLGPDDALVQRGLEAGSESVFLLRH